MNIVKIQDIILTPQTSSFTEDECQVFNSKFRGKYVHCINWTYCFPFDELTQSKVIEYSELLCRDMFNPFTQNSFNVNAFDEYHYIKIDKIRPYIEWNETEKINSIKKYEVMNDYVSDDITLDQLKKFRTWLASTLLTFDIEDTKTTHMLIYYANGMYDGTVEALSEFGTSDTHDILNTVNSTSCGCAGGASLTSAAGLSLCDPLNIYRRNIYTYMVSVFSNIDFWLDFDPEFLTMFKKYIDGILQHNLPLQNDDYSSHFVDCTCQLKGNTSQELNRQILIKLSKSLQYMIDDEVKGNRNYIATSFTDWATYLYEKMEW